MNPSHWNDSTPTRSSDDVFCESLVKGAGMAVGGAIVGALIAFILCPAPGSAEAGAEIGRRIAGAMNGDPVS